MSNQLQHIQILTEELERRKQANKRYSLRAFARYLELDASALSRILSGKQELSISVCLKVLKRLKLPEDRQVQFVASLTEEMRKKATFLIDKAIDINGPPLHQATSSVLVAGEQKLNNGIFSFALDLIFVIDRKGRYLYVNDAGAKQLSCTSSEAIGKTRRQLKMSPELVNQMEFFEARVFSSGEALKYELPIKNALNCRYYEVILTPIRNEKSEVYAILADMREITERKQAEDRLSFLSKAARIFASTLDLNQTRKNIVEVVIGDFAEFCILHLFNEVKGHFELAEAMHRVSARNEHLYAILEKNGLNVAATYGISNVLSGASLPLEYLEFAVVFQAQSMICVPMRLREKIIGAITLGRGIEFPAFNTKDLELAHELAFQASLTVENAKLYNTAKALREENSLL